MSQFFVIESFELHENQLDNWVKLSAEIDQDIAKADGFISRDSGIDEDNRVYCLVKWESRAQQEAFMAELTSREDWDEMMGYFGTIANLETNRRQEIELFM